MNQIRLDYGTVREDCIIQMLLELKITADESMNTIKQNQEMNMDGEDNERFCVATCCHFPNNNLNIFKKKGQLFGKTSRQFGSHIT